MSLARKVRTIVLKADPKDPSYANTIGYCARILSKGGLVVFPTETVYGIAAEAFNKKAVTRLDRVKSRPKGKPYTVHIADVGQISKMGCIITDQARRLMDKYWPGPLTIILKSKKGVKTGFRMPVNRIALDLIRAARNPLVAPSANLGGNLPPTSAGEALKELNGTVDVILDGGSTEVGVESTVVDLTVSPVKILRKGAIKELS